MLGAEHINNLCKKESYRLVIEALLFYKGLLECVTNVAEARIYLDVMIEAYESKKVVAEAEVIITKL